MVPIVRRANEANIRKRAFPSPEALRKDLRRFGHPEAEDPETVERIFRDIHSGTYKLPLTKNHMLQHMFDQSQKVAQVLLELDWTFAWAPADTSFVTSDDPVLLLDSDLKAASDFFGEVGFASPNTMKVLPLKEDLCLLVGSRGHSISHCLLDRQTVRRLNLEQTKHYERWLIARDEALLERLVG